MNRTRRHNKLLDRADRSSLRAAFLPEWFGNPYQVQLDQALSALGVKMIRVGRTARAIAVSLLRHRPQVLHLHWLHAFYEVRNRRSSALKLIFSWMGLALMRLLGTRIVWTVHNLAHHERMAPRLDRWISRWVARHAHAVIAHSETAKRQIAKSLIIRDIERIRVIPHGHFVGAYPNNIDRDVARRELNLRESDVVFLFLGQVRPYKGVPELIDAFRSLPTPAARLLIAGKPLSGRESDLIKARVDCDARITFAPGHVPDERIQVYMNACDAVVLPYREVLTSGAAILAMSYARACIAPRLGCMMDLFADSGGILYDSDSREGLRGALAEAVDARSDLKAMGDRNRQHVDGWSWDHVARLTLAVYQDVLNR